MSRTFENAKISDKVYHIRKGWGIITHIETNGTFSINVRFKDGINIWFLKDGREFYDDVNPTLFWDEINFEIPFSLEDELRKLEVVEFKNEYDNYFIYWSNNFQEICLKSYSNIEIPMIKHFSKESAYNFKKSIENKSITKEQFFSAYKKVFGGRND